MKECPGGCAIWALLCAPSTYSDFCLHAYNKERDVQRKQIFYPIAGAFLFGFIYMVSREDNSNSIDFDDNDYKRADNSDMNYKDRNVTNSSDASGRDSEEEEAIRNNLFKEHKVLSNEQIEKVIKKQSMIRQAQEAKEELKTKNF